MWGTLSWGEICPLLKVGSKIRWMEEIGDEYSVTKAPTLDTPFRVDLFRGGNHYKGYELLPHYIVWAIDLAGISQNEEVL